jgi:hypothetical protein
MANAKVDPTILEREYVTSTISIRKLAERHGLSWSAVATRARKKDAAGLTWEEKRQAFQQSVAAKSYDKTAVKLANEEVDIRSELINVNRATLAVYITQLREGKIIVGPRDAVAATSALMNLLGEPTSRTETTIVDGTGFAREELQRIVEIARSRIIEGPVAGPDEPEPARTRSH